MQHRTPMSPPMAALFPTAAVAALLLAAPPAFAQTGGPGTGTATETLLEEEWARLEPLSGGRLGLAAIHLESGRAAYLHPDEPFPMASTYKVPIAVELLRRVDEGELALDGMVELRPSDLSPGSGVISRLFDDPGVSLSLLNLMELMLLISDNSATDLCLRAAGGGERVTERMAELGVAGIRVARSTADLITDYVGAEGLPPREERRRATYTDYYEQVSPEDRESAREAFEADQRDTATPRGMADLLVRIWKGEGLSPESRDLLIDIMERCETGAGRLKGRLPEGTVVAHKTGTIGRTTNDVGIVTLPSGAGHVVVVAFVKDSEEPVPEREAAIAEAARAAHDYFLFVR